MKAKVEKSVMADTVLVDVYTWYQNVRSDGMIPIEGIYRFANVLARRYTPVILLAPGEGMDLEKYVVLHKAFGDAIHIVYDIKDLRKQFDRARIWLSIGVNCASPMLPTLKDAGFLRVAMLHDAMAAYGRFGVNSEADFIRGALNHDVFAGISRYAIDAMRHWLYTSPFGVSPAFVETSGFHAIDVTQLSEETPESRASKSALGVATVYARKQVRAAAEFAVGRGYKYTHVGDIRDKGKWLETRHPLVNMMGPASDYVLDMLYRTSSVLISLSVDEGFSLPPLEAAVYGVPSLVLSDIPVHRELYASCSQLVKLDALPFEIDERTVDPDYRNHLAQRFGVNFVMLRFDDTLAQLI